MRKQQAYDNYLSGVAQKLNQLSVLGQLEGQNYDVYNSEQNYRQNSQLMNQENAQATREDARAQLQAVLEAGGTPSEDLWGAAGYDPSVRKALTALYAAPAGNAWTPKPQDVPKETETAGTGQNELNYIELQVGMNRTDTGKVSAIKRYLESGQITEAQAQELLEKFGLSVE